ncbi:sulfurtransferase TusA family protein [Pelagibacterium montanilacus]|uniref:sulfurtransferase TusA family protein n=1 Tax=Pelagibacterium montanilacus TaxID=2185280 RepID=UPI001FE5D4DD|nr:sulfurtransferase TusA family protein [Pelagibacterium montanilacus]
MSSENAAENAVVIDARGLKCPMPVLKAEKRLSLAAPGERFMVLATDPLARIDVAAFCQKAGHACSLDEADGVLRFAIIAGPRRG